jgi:hypothetical protein
MSDLLATEIDFDVHKKIKTGRKNFSESSNEVLRRLLNLGKVTGIVPSKDSRRPWSGKRVTLPHGTELRMEYNGHQDTGTIIDGEWLVEGKHFMSPSVVSEGVTITKDGKHTRLDE